VTGQINFADGTVQSTAYEPRVVAPEDRFSFPFSVDYKYTADVVQVPVGQELVILRVYVHDVEFGATNLGHLQLQSTNDVGEDIVPLATLMIKPSAVGLTRSFPDGLIVVDEERFLAVFESHGYFEILGYYRDKP
jgi:hypothetical protein